MKRYYVTVNGNRYEVEVEEVRGEFPPAAITSEKAVHKEHMEEFKEVAETTAKAPVMEEPKAEAKKAALEVKGEKITCPMPGTIFNIAVNEGQQVKKGDVILVLEAMKMENEIMSPKDGKVAEIAVAKGQQMNTGDLLAIIE
ncbi:Biotin-requiring enzyme [Clostridium amylolyticum]|uniref:Biotin-requiring enzyme n=1 Tax=Clostridium amylolyticum TaxID=1121298 RepID=A0A1M6LGC6_9CLOT|nr:DUF2118 domain-containing protein [Clostridium amylolyticum]SHJ70274.1 Biotin-requiring enzyme [Clostridium amylolyticum]